MATPQVAALEAELKAVLATRARRSPSPRPRVVGEETVPRGSPARVDRELSALCRERGPLRAVLARLACRLVSLRAWERLSYARLTDYAVECLGLSARSVRSLAEVGVQLEGRPLLEDALVSGALGWTKVRLLARLPRDEDDAAWIDYARRVTAEELSRAVRTVDRGSVEAGGAELDEPPRSRLFEVRCTPEVRWKWYAARGAAARVAGRVVHVSEAAELIAAEVLSALPIDEGSEDEACGDHGVSWTAAGAEDANDTRPSDSRSTGAGLPWPDVNPARSGTSTSNASPAATGPPWRARGGAPRAVVTVDAGSRAQRPSFPPDLRALLDGIERLDAFEIDDRFRRALSMERRLEGRIGPLLTRAWQRWVYRSLGFETREAYARERLGMDPTRARALVRLERAAAESPSFARAYREGALSWVKADVLMPLVTLDPLGVFIEGWLAWARRVTVRRLREDVEHAVALAETAPSEFRRDGGLPAEAQNREIGAAGKDVTASGTARPCRDVGAPGAGLVASADNDDGAGYHRHPEPLKRAPAEICWARFIGPPDVVQLFHAVLSTVRRRMEREEGRLPTAGEALGAMLDHALSTWGALDGEAARRRYEVFARDGWRCAVPGCTSMQNLHDHHIRFRSAGGGDALGNRVTLCAFHHLRGVHAGLLRCLGRAPGGLRWEMGIRPGVSPRLAYRSGDVRVSGGVS